MLKISSYFTWITIFCCVIHVDLHHEGLQINIYILYIIIIIITIIIIIIIFIINDLTVQKVTRDYVDSWQCT